LLKFLHFAYQRSIEHLVLEKLEKPVNSERECGAQNQCEHRRRKEKSGAQSPAEAHRR
jgi:hypothetical protein